MSLLLDALKKAAEQKAAKAREKEAESPPGDETALGSPADDTGVGLAEDDGSLPHHQLEDETELDHSEIQTRLERARPMAEDGTETGLEVPDSTGTEMQARSQQIKTGEDETIIFDEDDIAEFMDESPHDSAAQRPSEDETDLSQLTRGEDSRPGEAASADPGAAEAPREDTDIRIPAPPDDTGAAVPGGDETDISIPPARAEDVVPGAPGTRSDTADDTNLGGPAMPPTDADEDITSDDDMSLMLVEREQTSFTSPTSATDPQRPEDQFGALRGEAPVSDDMSLLDTTRQQADSATRTRGSDTATTGIAERTQASQVPRPDPTATHTYAPDNYDRTLMRLPNDDASRLFAGMKSDSDVVMTPDYAKKVFRSKSSAQRVQNYKIYGGIAIAILLAVGVYGVLEYQSEVERIDTSLRPLKRDPMPGVIRPRGQEEDTALFVEGAVDERTVQLIQNAEDLEPIPDSGVIAETEEAPPTETVEPAAELAQSAPAETTPPADTSGESAVASEPVAMNAPPRTDPGGAETATSNLQIRSSNRIQRRQVLLREAYEAYQAGNDMLALERYNEVLAIDPGNRNALLGRAAINVQNDNGGAAIRDYRTLLLANPKDSLAMASLLAVANFSPRATETQLKLMIRDEPESPYLNFALANAYGAQNRWQEAQGHYFVALEHNPGNPNYAYNLAVSLEHISQPKAAISFYRRALENYNNGLATFSREVVDRRLEILEKQ